MQHVTDMQATTDEEKEWETAAAAYDGGKGLPLRECDPDGEDMSFVCDALNVQNFAARKRLHAYVRRLRENRQQRPPTNPDRTEQVALSLKNLVLSSPGSRDSDESGAQPPGLGSHTVKMDVDSLVEFIVGKQRITGQIAPNPVNLHSTTDLAFVLQGRDNAKSEFTACLQQRSTAFGETLMPHDRTKYPIPVFSGMKGLGKTRMLEEWENLFSEAEISKPYLGLMVTYGNGHGVSFLDKQLPIEAGFSWRMLHRLFIEGNCGDSESLAWNSEGFIPRNASQLSLELALRVLRSLAERSREVETQQTLSLFIGVDEYQKIPNGPAYEEALALLLLQKRVLSEEDEKRLRGHTYLWELIEALQDNCHKIPGLRIFPAFAGTRWGPLIMAGSSVPDALRVPINFLSPQQMEDVVASNDQCRERMVSPTFRRGLFFFGGVPRPSLEYALSGHASFDSVWDLRVKQQWQLTSEQLLRLVASAVSGKSVQEADPSGIMDELSWGALADQGLCLIREDGQVSIPYCVFRLASFVDALSLSLAQQCLVQNLEYLRDRVDAGLFADNEPWQLWEKFGACFFAMRINSLLILGETQVPFKRLCLHAAVNGCTQQVHLDPMKVFHIEEPLSVELGDTVTETMNHNTFNWVQGDSGIRYCLVNGFGGEGVDIFCALRLVDGPFLFYGDQRKRVAGLLGTASANDLIAKQGIVPSCLGENADYVLGLFSLLACYNDDPSFLYEDSFVLSYPQHNSFHGCLSSHPACSPVIDVNYANVSTLKLLKSVKDVVSDIVKHRKTKEFCSLDAFKEFCQEHGAFLNDADAKRCVAYSLQG